MRERPTNIQYSRDGIGRLGGEAINKGKTRNQVYGLGRDAEKP